MAGGYFTWALSGGLLKEDIVSLTADVGVERIMRLKLRLYNFKFENYAAHPPGLAVSPTVQTLSSCLRGYQN